MATEITLRAVDGYLLGATRFEAQGHLRGHLVVAGATAVPQGFYRRFAEHAAARGYTVTTFDYRGIGRSAPPSLAGFVGDILDWARLDLAAVVDAAPHGAAPLLMVGHSFGGQALGLLPNHARIAGLAAFGTGTGWHGWMPPLERLKVHVLWRLVGPWLVWRHGYLAWSRIGMGADVPRGVYHQWKRWCRFPRYFFDDPAMRETTRGFASVKTPIVTWNALGDHWATPASRDAFMAGYSGAVVDRVDIHDRKLGHMGYFRPQAQPVWDEALNWFDTLVAEHARQAQGMSTRGCGANS